MATEVTVEASGGQGNVMSCEVSGGDSSDNSCGTYKFKIGAIGSMVCYLTVVRRVSSEIKIIATSGDIIVDIDKKDKKVKKGKSVLLPSKAKRAVIREKP